MGFRHLGGNPFFVWTVEQPDTVHFLQGVSMAPDGLLK